MSATTTPQAAGMPAAAAPQSAGEGFGQPQAAPAPQPTATPGQVPAATGTPAATPPAPQAPAPAAPAAPTAPQVGEPQQPQQTQPVVLGPDGQPFDFDRNQRLIDNLRADNTRLKQGHGYTDPSGQPAPTQQPTPVPGNPAPAAPAQAPAAGDPAAQALAQVTALQRQLADNTLRNEFTLAATQKGVRADAIDFALQAARQNGLQIGENGMPLNAAEVLDRVRASSAFLFDSTAPAPGQAPAPAAPGAPAPTPAPWGVPNANGGNGSAGAGGPAPVVDANEAMMATAMGMTTEQWVAYRDTPAGQMVQTPAAATTPAAPATPS